MRVIYLMLCGMVVVGCSLSSGKDAARLIAQKSALSSMPIVDSWSFRAFDSIDGDDTLSDVEWIDATVPGTVHTDLMAAGIIKEPFASTSENELQWIEHKQWHYQTNFTPLDAMLDDDVQELVFKGLDTYADVYLNNTLVLSADNMYTQWRVKVNGVLKKGSNHLLIKFYPAYERGVALSQNYSVKLPADNDKGEVKTSIFTRKAPYHFGWDWGPRYVTVGVWRPIAIESWSHAKIDNVQYVQKSQSDEFAAFDAKVTVVASQQSNVSVLVCDSAGKIYVSQDFDLATGQTTLTLPFEIENPKLWWPNGTDKANLYKVYAIVANRDCKKKLDQYSANIGVRTIELMQPRDSVGGGSAFYFAVNGEPVFAKGANYIPLDVFLPRVSADKYEKFIKACVESNYNMIRVWGGGVYEDDIFYDLCDKYGIMVWQDFMFACSLYPWDKAFLASVEREAVYNVRRLRNHPSIAIWCGNNEIDELWHNWGYQKAYGWSKSAQDTIYRGMRKLFYDLLPSVVKREDATRFYHPSSPMYGRGDNRSQIMGDTHYWGVFHDGEPFNVYKDKPGRFSNEYGFQSLACYDTYRQYFESEELLLYSDAMVVHQKNARGYDIIEQYMARDLPVIKSDFRVYVYLSQLLQGEGIKIAMDGHRQKRPWTMGSLYWQVNDCWPAASWSSMDSEMRYKALHYYARRSFEPTALSFEAIDSTATVRLWGVTDRLQSQKGKVTLKLIDFSGVQLWAREIELNIPRNGNQMLLDAKVADILNKVDPRAVVLVATTTIEGKELRALHYFTQMKNLKLPKADFEVDYIKGENGQVSATITAKKLLRAVLFEADKLQRSASDGYFDMLPGESRTIELHFEDDLPISELGIFVTTLNKVMVSG